MKTLVCAMLLMTTIASGGEIIRRGEAIPRGTPVVALEDVLAKPSEFTAHPFVTAGVVERVCWFGGCWMTVAPAAGKRGVHVTFKNGAFVVPRNSGGQNARLLGKVRITDRNVSFVASGVELLPSKRQ